MSKGIAGPLAGVGIRIRNNAELEEFLGAPGAPEAVASSSFEQVFFTLKSLGLADALDLLPMVTGRQIRGFVDLDCWRKDRFVPKPLMEWIAAFVQAGPDETARALAGMDDTLVALFLKDLITVYEVERDEPPPAAHLIYTPDNTLAVEQEGTGDAATIAALVLDAMFKHRPELGYGVLRKVRYVTRTELEETAYRNKVRRLEVHGFVDYYEALSIYAGPDSRASPPPPRETAGEAIPGDEPPQSLPTVFADSLSEGGFLHAAMRQVDGEDADRLAEELTALGNRILSANLVNLGEVEGIRIALGELRDFLTIGLEHLSGRDAGAAARHLRSQHAQGVFKAGFDLLAGLRGRVEKLARFPGFKPDLLESPDQEFVAGLARFKPLLWDGGQYRNFRGLAEVEQAGRRLEDIETFCECLLREFGPSVETTLRQAFNTAVVQQAVTGRFEPRPVGSAALEALIADGVNLPEPDLPDAARTIFAAWLEDLKRDLEPLAGKRIDPRFVGFVNMES